MSEHTEWCAGRRWGGGPCNCQPESTPTDNALPAGKTCQDCNHIYTCEALDHTRPADTKCYYMPSRFVDADAAKPESDTPRTDALIMGAQKHGQAFLDHIKNLERENANMVDQRDAALSIIRSKDKELARLREVLERIHTGDRGDWGCQCPAGAIAWEALKGGNQ